MSKPKPDKIGHTLFLPKEGETFVVKKVEEVHDKAHGLRLFVTLESVEEPTFRTLLEVVPH